MNFHKKKLHTEFAFLRFVNVYVGIYELWGAVYGQFMWNWGKNSLAISDPLVLGLVAMSYVI